MNIAQGWGSASWTVFELRIWKWELIFKACPTKEGDKSVFLSYTLMVTSLPELCYTPESRCHLPCGRMVFLGELLSRSSEIRNTTGANQAQVSPPLISVLTLLICYTYDLFRRPTSFSLAPKPSTLASTELCCPSWPPSITKENKWRYTELEPG